MNNKINYAGVSPKVTPASIRDNVEDIKNTIRRSDRPLLYAVLRNPEPCDTFKLIHKVGEDYYSTLPWYKKRSVNPFAKHNFIYSDNIYSGQTWYESTGFSLSSNPYITTYTETELQNFIKNKAKNLSWAHYIWCKDRTPKTPVWYNYSIDLVWSNKYGNSTHSTRIFLLEQDKKVNQKLVDDLNKEFAISFVFNRVKDVSELLKEVNEKFNDSTEVPYYMDNRESRQMNIAFIKNRVMFLENEVYDIDAHWQDFHGKNKTTQEQLYKDYKEEIIYRVQDYDAMRFDTFQTIELNYDDYPLKLN